VASYRLLITASAAKELESVASKKDRQRLVTRIRSLATNPRPPSCQKIAGTQKHRIRQVNYRNLYLVDDDEEIVTIVKFADRKEVYR
jgi:mRNA-degrading endonuclease RelE of RelBE toxin-antitoxin system